MRHAGTVGRAQTNPIKVSGPPLTWENNGTTRSDDSSTSGGTSTFSRRDASGSSDATTINGKSELPSLPPSSPSTPRKASHQDQQATIRNGPSAAPARREPSDEYDDDYEDEPNGYPPPAATNGRPPVDDELPDTTMLDSVVLPAIASVCLRV